MSKSTTSNTSMHPDALGAGNLGRTIVRNMTRATGTNSENALRISYNPKVGAGMVPAVTPHAGTVTITADTSLVLKVENRNASGTANSDVSFTITFGAAKVGWSSGAATAYSVKDIIDLINESDAGGTSGELLDGFQAWAQDAPYDLPVNTASRFVSTAETYLLDAKNGGTACLTRDLDVDTVDSDYIVYMRINGSSPAAAKQIDRKAICFLDIWGTITGTTNGTVKIYSDDPNDYVLPTGTYATDLANHTVLAQFAGASLSANRGTSPGVATGSGSEPESWNGPLIVEIKSDDVSATNVNVAFQAV